MPDHDGCGRAESRFQIRLEREAASFDCGPGQTLLDAMERVGIGREAVGCRGGGCGRCRIRIIEGTIVRGKMSRAHVDLEQEQRGYALACRAYPRSDLILSWAPSIGAAARSR